MDSNTNMFAALDPDYHISSNTDAHAEKPNARAEDVNARAENVNARVGDATALSEALLVEARACLAVSNPAIALPESIVQRYDVKGGYVHFYDDRGGYAICFPLAELDIAQQDARCVLAVRLEELALRARGEVDDRFEFLHARHSTDVRKSHGEESFKAHRESWVKRLDWAVKSSEESLVEARCLQAAEHAANRGTADVSDLVCTGEHSLGYAKLTRALYDTMRSLDEDNLLKPSEYVNQGYDDDDTEWTYPIEFYVSEWYYEGDPEYGNWIPAKRDYFFREPSHVDWVQIDLEDMICNIRPLYHAVMNVATQSSHPEHYERAARALGRQTTLLPPPPPAPAPSTPLTESLVPHELRAWQCTHVSDRSRAESPPPLTPGHEWIRSMDNFPLLRT